jgi:hypothetical protein
MTDVGTGVGGGVSAGAGVGVGIGAGVGVGVDVRIPRYSRTRHVLGALPEDRALRTWSMAVLLKHQLVVCAVARDTRDFDLCTDMHLRVYSLRDGSLVRVVENRERSGRAYLRFEIGDSICATPDADCVLLTDSWNRRVAQVNVVRGTWVRDIEGIETRDRYSIDCDADTIAVGSYRTVTLLSWATGMRRCVCSRRFSGVLPISSFDLGIICGTRLLSGGRGVVAAFTTNMLIAWDGNGGIMWAAQMEVPSFNFLPLPDRGHADDTWLVSMRSDGRTAMLEVWRTPGAKQTVGATTITDVTPEFDGVRPDVVAPCGTTGDLVCLQDDMSAFVVYHRLEVRFTWLDVIARLVRVRAGGGGEGEGGEGGSGSVDSGSFPPRGTPDKRART